MVIVKFIFLLGLLMAKYTAQDIKTLAWVMRIAKAEGRPFAVLTGAGCSKTAEVRLAGEIVDFVESSKYGLMIRVRESLSTLKGLEYGYVMSKLLPKERKAILTEVLKDAKVNWGHIALAALMKAEYVGRVLTFNFDSFLARASGINGMYPATYDFGVSSANNLQHVVTPSILHLHGQGHGPDLVNTLNQSDLLVIGYGAKSDKAFPFLHRAFATLDHGNQSRTGNQHLDSLENDQHSLNQPTIVISAQARIQIDGISICWKLDPRRRGDDGVTNELS
jgi:hypothetical protein